MKYFLMAALLALTTACTPRENEGGTPLPGASGSGAPLLDDAVEPSEQQDEIDDEGG